MTENPERLVSDSQQRQPIDYTDWSYKGYFLALGIVFLAFAVSFAVIVTVRARSHNVDLWLINGVNRLLAISLACTSLRGGYRRIKTTAVGSWSPGQLLLFIKSTFTLMFRPDRNGSYGAPHVLHTSLASASPWASWNE